MKPNQPIYSFLQSEQRKLRIGPGVYRTQEGVFIFQFSLDLQ